MYLGKDVKEYKKCGEEIINEQMKNGNIRCELCTRTINRHSSYERGIKESGEKIKIIMVWCDDCNHGHALLPDFLLPHKHYSGNEIESVMIDSVDSDGN